MNVLNKLDCYITLVWKGLPGINTLTYWGNYKVTKLFDTLSFEDNEES